MKSIHTLPHLCPILFLNLNRLSLLALATMLILITPGASLAEPPPFNPNVVGIKPISFSDQPTRFADIDGDGDQDIVANTGDLVWYENGDPWVPHFIVEAGHGDIGLGDLDSDGDVDVVYQAGGRMLAAMNQGDGSSWISRVICGGCSGSGVVDVETGDLNSDGNIDILLADSTGLRYFEGQGNGTFPRVGDPLYSAPDLVDCLIEDLSGDGVADVVFTRSAGLVGWLRNDGGDPLSFMELSISTAVSSPRRITASDLDGDNDLDVLTISGLDGNISWFENEGTTSFPHTLIPTTLASAELVIAGDIDEDGNLDLVAAGEGVRSYFNDGSMSFTEANVSGLADVSALLLFDADHNGLKDILFEAQGQLGYFPRELFAGPDLLPSRQVLTAGVPVDFDQDGDMDLVSTSSSTFPNHGAVLWFENRQAESAGFEVHEVFSSQGASFRSPSAKDMDGDGHTDIVVLQGGWIRVFFNTQGDHETFVTRTIGTVENRSDLGAADVNGDGHMDLVYGSLGGLFWLENDGATSPGFDLHTINTVSTAPKFELSDLDMDGDIDVVFVRPLDDRVGWARNLNHGQSWAGAPLLILPSPTDVHVTNTNQDEDRDIIVSSDGLASLVLLRNIGDNTMVFEEVVVSQGETGAQSVGSGDFDNDGDTDFVLGRDEGHVRVVEQRPGIGWFPRTLDQRGNVLDVGTADFDCDGSLEILATDTHRAELRLYQNILDDPVFSSRIGNVNAAAGAPQAVLYVNGSPGSGAERSVTLAPSDPLSFRMELPSSRAEEGFANMVVYAWFGEPSATTVTNLPFGLGVSGMPMFISGGNPIRILNNIGKTSVLGTDNWPRPNVGPAPVTFLNLQNGAGRAGTFFLQGLILDESSPQGQVAVTNGVLVRLED